MLSGICPRGSSKAPGNGKIGITSARSPGLAYTAFIGMVALQRTQPLLVSRFRRSYHFAAHSRTNVGTKGHYQLYDSSVALDLTFLQRTRGNADRNVKSATLVSRFLRV